MSVMREVQKASYNVIFQGHPALHRELAWYATEDETVIGVVILDLVDGDYSWVALTKQPVVFKASDLGTSCVSRELAMQQLQTAMGTLRCK